MLMNPLQVKTIEKEEAFLRQISTSVDLNDENLPRDIQILEEYCKEHEVMAMAAVQLGIPKRLMYLKNTNLDVINRQQTNSTSLDDNMYNEEKVLINPVIVERIGLTEYWEACASCLDYVGLVQRPYKIVVEYLTLQGVKKRETFEGFPATVVSHENDHFDGVLHIDIAIQLFQMPVEDRKLLRQREPYRILTKEGKYEDLIKSSKEKKKIL